MYEYTKGNWIYYGDQHCGSPRREVKPISEQEAKYWDRLEKEIRRVERGA